MCFKNKKINHENGLFTLLGDGMNWIVIVVILVVNSEFKLSIFMELEFLLSLY